MAKLFVDNILLFFFKGFVAIAGHTMGETTQACGATHGRKRKNEKAGKNKNSKKVVEVNTFPGKWLKINLISLPSSASGGLIQRNILALRKLHQT